MTIYIGQEGLVGLARKARLLLTILRVISSWWIKSNSPMLESCLSLVTIVTIKTKRIRDRIFCRSRFPRNISVPIRRLERNKESRSTSLLLRNFRDLRPSQDFLNRNSKVSKVRSKRLKKSLQVANRLDCLRSLLRD